MSGEPSRARIRAGRPTRPRKQRRYRMPKRAYGERSDPARRGVGNAFQNCCHVRFATQRLEHRRIDQEIDPTILLVLDCDWLPCWLMASRSSAVSFGVIQAVYQNGGVAVRRDAELRERNERGP